MTGDTHPALTEAERRDARAWLLRLEDEELRSWLREALWHEQTDPIRVGAGAEFADLLGGLVARTPRLVTSFRRILPVLTNEWTQGERSGALFGLLSLNKRLQVVGAEDAIRRVLRRELGGDDAELARLRGLACRVLVKLGPSAAATRELWMYVGDPNCVGPCFRGLYEHDLATIRSSFPRVLVALENRDPEVVLLLRGLLRRRVDSDQLPEVFPNLASQLEPTQLGRLARLLRPIGFELDLESGSVYDFQNNRLLIAKIDLPRLGFTTVFEAEREAAVRLSEFLKQYGDAPTLADVVVNKGSGDPQAQ